MNIDPFKEYIKQSEPNKRDKGYAWHTAIGLQAVDGLKPSRYLIDTAIKNIEGDISIDEAQELLNRSMHISGMFEKVDIECSKVDIENEEVDIDNAKVDIRNRLLSFSDMISEKTINHAQALFSKCGKEGFFGRTIVENITGLKPSGASKLIKLLVVSKVIVPVTGHGKGKYRFQ